MIHTFKLWLKTGDTPLARFLYNSAWRLIHLEVPAFKPIFKPLLLLHVTIRNLAASIARIFYWTPLFKASIDSDAKHLYLYEGLPVRSGPLKVTIGERCRINGQTTFSGRAVARADQQQPHLKVGSNVDIGWHTTIAVGTLVSIGDNVRIAGRAFLAGYPGHPINLADRAAGKPDLDSQTGDIILEDDVWLATGVSVMPGVTIGKGTIVAAESVVTADLPPGVLAGGIPAKVIKTLDLNAS